MYRTIRKPSNLGITAWRAAACAAAFAAAAFPAAAQEDTQYFRGKTVSYIVATAPGGGFDFYGRLAAEYMERYLPGSKFVVKNMPGAGHVIGLNAVYAAKPDGLTLGTFNTSLIYNQLVGSDSIRADFAKMSWIGKAASDPRVIVISQSSPIKTFADLKASPTVNFASGGLGGGGYLESKVLIDTLQLPVKLLAGYNGNDDQLAMRRGEITGIVSSRSSSDEFVKNGYGRYIAQIGGAESDVPQLAAFVESPQAKSLVALIQSQGDISRLTAGPPAIPAGMLATLRAAYNKAMADPELQEKALKGGRPIESASGETVERMIKSALDQSPQTIALLRDALNVKPSESKSAGPLQVEDGGRKIVISGPDGKPLTLEPSGSRTKITIAGKEAGRADLKSGLACEVTYTSGNAEPSAIVCQ